MSQVVETIQRMSSGVQRPCRFIATKESVKIIKELNSHRIGLVQQHGRRFGTPNNMAAMTSCAYAPWANFEVLKFYFGS